MPTATATKERVKSKKTDMVPEVAPRQTRGDYGFAVIETGGKQYKVAVGDVITVEKIKGEFKEDGSVTFDKVLLLDNGITQIGTPFLDGVKVTGIITEIGRGKKVVVIHYKQKSRYFKKAGHRQPYFKVKIDKIG